MAKKHKHPEHINLERWLISYADFITLLFATFVVLYALSQVDIKGFQSLEASMREAFAAPSIIEGSQGVMQDSSGTLFDSSQADSMITPLMMEYMSQKYEDQSMDEIEKEVNQATKTGEIEGVEAIESDRGLIIRFKDDYLFAKGSAALSQSAKIKLDKIGAIIGKRFFLHMMRVEGHTDNQVIKSTLYPSNWELSSSRAGSIVRYFIDRFNFMPSLFTVVGFADTRPLEANTSEQGRSRNRRVEILILKNKFKAQETPMNDIMKMNKDEQEKFQARRIDSINRIQAISDAARKLSNGNKAQEAKTIILNQSYDKEIKRISIQTQALDPNVREKVVGPGNWLKPPAEVDKIKVFK